MNHSGPILSKSINKWNCLIIKIYIYSSNNKIYWMTHYLNTDIQLSHKQKN